MREEEGGWEGGSCSKLRVEVLVVVGKRVKYHRVNERAKYLNNMHVLSLKIQFPFFNESSDVPC